MWLTGHTFRQYTVLPCSPSFEIHSNCSALRQKTVLLRSLVFSVIGALTVVFDREFGGQFLENSAIAGSGLGCCGLTVISIIVILNIA